MSDDESIQIVSASEGQLWIKPQRINALSCTWFGGRQSVIHWEKEMDWKWTNQDSDEGGGGHLCHASVTFHHDIWRMGVTGGQRFFFFSTPAFVLRVNYSSQRWSVAKCTVHHLKAYSEYTSAWNVTVSAVWDCWELIPKIFNYWYTWSLRLGSFLVQTERVGHSTLQIHVYQLWFQATETGACDSCVYWPANKTKSTNVSHKTSNHLNSAINPSPVERSLNDNVELCWYYFAEAAKIAVLWASCSNSQNVECCIMLSVWV